MSVITNGDSTWTTTDVASQTVTGSSINISGTSSDQKYFVMLYVNGFRAGKGTYDVVNVSIPNGLTTAVSYAYYGYKNNVEWFTYGQIVITEYSDRTMQGTFNLQGQNINVTGTFTTNTP